MRGTLLILLFPSILFAQNPLPKGENRFSRLSIEDGLSQVGVLDIVQDRKGFMWIATRDGLNRYDGQNFVVYRKKRGDTTSLNHNRIWSLAQDLEGNIWVGTNYGLAKYSYQTNRFTQYIPFRAEPYDLRNTIRTIYCQQNGHLLLGTENGAWVFDPETGSFDDEALTATSGSFVSDFLVLPSKQQILIATQKGLLLYNQQLELLHQFHQADGQKGSLGNEKVNSLFQDSQQRVWVGTDDGLYQYHPDQGSFTFFPNPLSESEEGASTILDMEEDDEGKLWIAASYLYSFQDGHYVAYFPHDGEDKASISGDYVTCISKSNDGVLWMGSDRFGLNIYNPTAYPFEYMGLFTSGKRGLGNSFVTAIQPTPDGKLLVGTATTLDLVSLEDQRRLRSYKNPVRFRNNPLWVLGILPQPNKNQYWLATMQGVGVYDYPSGEIAYPLAGRLDIRVNRIELLSQNEILISTHGDGLYRYNHVQNTLTKITSADPHYASFSEELVRATLLLQDSLWIGTERGLYVYHLPTESMHKFVHDPTDPTSLPEDYIKHIFEDSSGTLWLGTWGGGLARYNPISHSFTTYGLDEGLPNQVIYGIMQDDAGYLWCSSNVGISRFDPEEEAFLNFDVDDGLQGNEFNTGAFHKRQDGTLFFGGVNGLNWFHPTKIQPQGMPPTTVITEFYLDNVVVEPGPNSVLPRNILETDT
ncbi:MAG TPA: hypothetical protein DCR93_19395, partial [Cytophagales bacterium]|nr:hypothetical protein [Cytophagales bacterium]